MGFRIIFLHFPGITWISILFILNSIRGSVSENFNFMGLCNLAFNCSHVFLETKAEDFVISKPYHLRRDLLPVSEYNILDLYSTNNLLQILTDDELFQHSLNRNAVENTPVAQHCERHCEKSVPKPDNVISLYQQQKDTGLLLATRFMLTLAKSMHQTKNYTLTHEHLVQMHRRLLGSISPRLAGRNRDVELKSAIR